MVFKRMYQASINQKSDIYAAALFTVDGLLVKRGNSMASPFR